MHARDDTSGQRFEKIAAGHGAAAAQAVIDGADYPTIR
jgi:hypothetical protein